MAGYQVGHRVTVYSGSSDSVQLFQVHSLKGQSNPYLSDVRITGRRIHVPECTAAPGQARFRVLDKRNASGDTTDRFLTEFLGDSENRHALRHSRVEVDVTDDGGSTWMREFTGRMHDIDQASKNEFEIIVNDLRADETDDIFDGTVPTVDWASEPILMPAGRLSGRQYGFFPTVTAPNADFEEVDFGGQYSASYAIATTERGPKTMVLQGLKEAAQYVKDSPGSGVRPRIAPDLRAFYEPGDSTYRGFHVGVLTPEDPSLNRLGRENVLSMDDGRLIGVLVENLDGDGDPAPLINTDGSMYLSSNAPPTTTAPLHIGVGSKRTGVNWAEVVSGVAHGAFGGGGFAIDYPRFNTLIQDDEQPKLRFRVKDGPVSASEWLETEVFPTVGYAPAVTASGTMYPVTYDPPDTTSGLFEFTRENVIDARWSQSRTGQINHVEIQMIAEREIPTDTIKFEDPVDLIVESDGDRVIVNRDDGKKRKPFQIKANGLRALYGATGLWSAIQWALQPIQLRKYAEERANRILDRFQDGTQDVVILARRTAGTKNVYIGDHVLVSVPWVPNYTQKVRGGTRLMLVLEKSVEPDGTYRFVCNDAGPVATASAPTLDGLDKNAVDGKHAYDVTITPPGDPERAILQVATVDSGAAEPSAGSELWTNAVGVSGTAQQSVTVSNLASRRTHWFRAQGRGPGKLPSAYTTALSGTTDAISAPSSLNVTISGAAAILTWTNGNASYPVMPVLGDPVASNYLDSPLEAGASRFRFVDLDPSTTYSFGVKHLDPYGGDSTTTSISGTTAGSASTLFAPQNLTILQGRTSDDQGQDGDVSLGTGIEIQWAKTEPYADTVVHYDDNSGFTSPTAVSGIETNRLRVNFPLDDTTRYFRAFHQEAGYTTSVASDTVSAKPVAFLDESSQFDGFASGSAALDVDPANDIILSVSSADPDTNGAYYTLNTSSFSEPTTSDNFIARGEMPYSQTQGVTLNSGTTGYLWLKFWSRTAGFGQSTKEQITVGTVPPDSIASEHLQDDSVITAKINDAAVEWAKIGDDAVRENNIIARGVAARHLFVGSFDNLVQNPGFEQGGGSFDGWETSDNGGSWSIGTTARSGGSAAQYDPTGQTANAEVLARDTTASLYGWAAAEGDQIYAEAYHRKLSTGTPNGANLYLEFRDENDAFISAVFAGAATPTTSFQKISVTATAPAGTASAYVVGRVENDGNPETIIFDDFYARRMVEGSIVVDGTLTATHVESLSFSGKTAIFDQGKVGGWTMASGTLSSFNATLDATNEQFRLGSASAPFVGTGVFIGNDGSGNYDARFGDPSGEYVFWDAGSGTLTHQGSRFTASNPLFTGRIDVEDGQGVTVLQMSSNSGDGGAVLFHEPTGGVQQGIIGYSDAGTEFLFDLDVDSRFDIEGDLDIATTTGGRWMIGDDTNTNMTHGVTINQAAADDQVLAFKSSDVAHGVTGVAETDTYGFVRKYVGTTGGVELRGISEGTNGIGLTGVATTASTSKTTGATANINLLAYKKSGTGTGAHGTNENLAMIYNGSVTRFIFDNEGDAHADVQWTTFDEHDDLVVLEDLEAHLAPGRVQRRFGDVVRHDRNFFEREGILHDVREEGGKMRGMLNQTKMLMLHSGAIRQVGAMLFDLRDENERLRARLASLEDGS